MIKILKRQLFKASLLPALFLLIQPVFFFYAQIIDQRFFYVLILGYFFLIIFLVYVRTRSLKGTTNRKLALERFQEDINLASADVASGQTAHSALFEQLKRYDTLERFTEQLNTILSEEAAAELLVSEAFRLVSRGKGTCILYVLDSQRRHLSIIATKKEDPEQVIKLKEGDIIDGWVMRKNQPVIITDIKKDFRFDLERISPDELRRFRSIIACPLTSGRKLIGVLRLDSPEESFFSSEDLRFLKTISDLGAVALENAQLYHRTEELAIRDGVTGLFLRRCITERLDTEIARAHRENSSLSVAMIDIDHFKKYNDTFGHAAGDMVLKSIASELHEISASCGAVVGRYGGEEFIVLFPRVSKKDAQHIAQVLRKQIEIKTMSLRKKHVKATVSIGIATFPEDARLSDELVQKADAALYKAKGKGRNTVCVA